MIYELKNVFYSYDAVPAIAGVNLNIEESESAVIIGANGSGKSTLVMMLAGLIFPSEGTIKFREKALTPLYMRNKDFSIVFRQKVGVMLQNPDALLFCDTVKEEIAFGPFQLGWSRGKIKDKVEEIANLLEIKNLLERPSGSLSFGEKKKVCLAAILATNPEILILDEPLSGLDPRSQAWTIEMLIRLKETSKTLIVTTHDLESVEDFGDRAIVFGDDHTILKDGRAHEILEDIPLLLKANLIHEHAHRHGRYSHIHPHVHRHEHEE